MSGYGDLTKIAKAATRRRDPDHELKDDPASGQPDYAQKIGGKWADPSYRPLAIE